jgi:hypothetical protein
MAMTEQENLVPIIVAVAAIGITLHVTRSFSILTTLMSKLSLKWQAKQRSSAPPDGSVTGVFIHPGMYILS